jgi:uncharacterized protein (DUF362 family)
MRTAWSRREILQLGAAASGALLAGAAGGCGGRSVACRSLAPNPFVESGRPLLVVVEGEDLTAMLRSGIEALGGLDGLGSLGRDAILRGNYVAGQPYPVTTAADVIVGVAGELRRAGFQSTTLFESHGTRLVPGLAPDADLRRLGVLDQVARHDIGVLTPDFFENDEFRAVRNPAWSVPSPVAVHRKLHEAGVIVSLPVVKRHSAARFTCALKMHFGSVSMADRLVAHKNEGRQEFFDQRLVHFADAVKPQLNVVDARALLTRNGPTLSGGGQVVRGVNRIVLCGDMVATDAYCARLLAEHDPTFSVEMIAGQLRHAAALGLGTADLAAVKIVERRV